VTPDDEVEDPADADHNGRIVDVIHDGVEAEEQGVGSERQSHKRRVVRGSIHPREEYLAERSRRVEHGAGVVEDEPGRESGVETDRRDDGKEQEDPAFAGQTERPVANALRQFRFGLRCRHGARHAIPLWTEDILTNMEGRTRCNSA
jgi:hypothetical protein